MKVTKLVLLSVFLYASCTQIEKKPNIIVILADDMGYADLGCTGSEIETPNLDRLATDGLLFTNCYNTARCCPSRASLLTGLYQHQAGVGAMNHDRGIPAYQGFLNEHCVTIAEVLQQNGYRTIMAGKWHVGDERAHWPDKRGFERFYGIPKGGGLYFYPSRFIDREVYKNGEKVIPDSSSFYSTDNFTTESIQFIKESRQEQKPFFLYLAYIAPHYPLQAWPKDIAKYDGVYDQGYHAIRNKRFEKQKKLELIPADLTISPRDFPNWDSVENKQEEIRKMQVYAAQVDNMDQNIGKLVEALEQMGELENTVIMFLSDNGACAQEENWAPGAEIGTAASFVSYGKNWANVSNVPFREYKQQTYEGGIITPLIVHWPAGIKAKQSHINELVHINDIMPTCLKIAGAKYPEFYNGHKITPLPSKSFLPLLKGNFFQHKQLFWEHLGNQAIRKEDLKLVKDHNQPWRLYDLAEDPTELNDLSAEAPNQVNELKSEYKAWMDRVGAKKWPVKKTVN